MAGQLTLKTSLLIPASVNQVWQILTNPESIKEFYFGMNWNTNWKKGSPIIITGNWDHESFEDKGNILDIEPGKFILFNLWISASGKNDAPEHYVTIRYELEPLNTETRLTIYQYELENESTLIATRSKWENVLRGIKLIAEKQ